MPTPPEFLGGPRDGERVPLAFVAGGVVVPAWLEFAMPPRPPVPVPAGVAARVGRYERTEDRGGMVWAGTRDVVTT